MQHWSKGFFLRPHPLAPTLSTPDGLATLNQLIAELASGNYPTTEKFIALIAECGLVSLWFYLKFIAGYSGPFNKLNTELHRDMCNFRQSDYCMAPGARAAQALPRKTFKTSIFTIGGTDWELNRDPNLRFRFTNAVVDRAYDFMHTVQRTRDSNDLYTACYPAGVIPKGSYGNNEKQMTCLNRTRYFTEPSIKCGGTGGAAAGDHHDVLVHDDLIDMTMLNQMQQAGAEIERAKSFMKTSQSTLVQSWAESRILVPHTRYATDDCYAPCWEDMKVLLGYQDPRFECKEDGAWTIYYRVAREDGEVIMPEAMTNEGLDKMARDDWWTYSTQYMNNPYDSGAVELSKLPHRLFNLEPFEDRWRILINKDDIVYLDSCDVVVGVDPAATEKNISSRTSRSAVVTWARDSLGRSFLLDAKAGYVEIFTVYDWVFDPVKRFSGAVRLVNFEKVAFQRILKPLLMAERKRRGLFVNIDGVGSGADKVARIRSAFATELEAGRIYINRAVEALFLEEKNVFPQSGNRMDLLDASEKALSQLQTPLSDDERAFVNAQDEAWESGYGRNSCTGYMNSIWRSHGKEDGVSGRPKGTRRPRISERRNWEWLP